MRDSWSGRVGILTLVLALGLASGALAEEARSLRGAADSERRETEWLAEVVVLRGARVGGAIPEPEPFSPAPLVVEGRGREPQLVSVIIVPIVSVTTPVSVLPARFVRRSPRRSGHTWRQRPTRYGVSHHGYRSQSSVWRRLSPASH